MKPTDARLKANVERLRELCRTASKHAGDTPLAGLSAEDNAALAVLDWFAGIIANTLNGFLVETENPSPEIRAASNAQFDHTESCFDDYLKRHHARGIHDDKDKTDVSP